MPLPDVFGQIEQPRSVRLMELDQLVLPQQDRRVRAEAAFLVVREVPHDLLSRPLHLALARAGQQRDDTSAVHARRQGLAHAGQLAERGQQVAAGDGHAARRPRLHAGPADDHRHADAALPQRALPAGQRAVRRSAAPAVVGHVDNVGVGGKAEPVDAVQQLAHAGVEVLGDGRAKDIVVVAALGTSGTGLLRGLPRVLRVMQRVMGQLYIEGRGGLGVLGHERDGPARDPEDVHRVGVLVRRGVAVARVAVVLVEAGPARPAGAQVPLAEVSRRVTRALQQVGERGLVSGDLPRDARRDQLVAGRRLNDRGRLRHAVARRALARQQAVAGRRADRRGGVRTREPHALARQPLQVGRAIVVAARVGHGIVHPDRRAIPALIVRQDEHEVGLALCLDPRRPQRARCQPRRSAADQRKELPATHGCRRAPSHRWQGCLLHAAAPHSIGRRVRCTSRRRGLHVSDPALGGLGPRPGGGPVGASSSVR